MTTREKIAEVNRILADGEPGNITVDQKGYAGYSPQATVDSMNQVFEIGEWGFDEITTPVKAIEGEKSVTFIANMRVWLATPDGERLPFQPTAYGEGTQPKHAPGDAMKAAQTDGIKKALSYFSIGNRAYLGKLSKPKTQPARGPASQPAPDTKSPNGNNISETQKGAIGTLLRIKGLREIGIDKEFGPVNSMTYEQAQKVIAHLSSLPNPT